MVPPQLPFRIASMRCDSADCSRETSVPKEIKLNPRANASRAEAAAAR
jgi:hypothetical protein